MEKVETKYERRRREKPDKMWTKDLTLSHKLWFSNPYIFAISCCKPLSFQTLAILSNRIIVWASTEYAVGLLKDIVIRKSEFSAKTFIAFSRLTEKKTHMPGLSRSNDIQVLIWYWLIKPLYFSTSIYSKLTCLNCLGVIVFKFWSGIDSTNHFISLLQSIQNSHAWTVSE